MSDNLSLMIGGKVHDRWRRYRVDSDLLMPADDWDMTAAVTPSEGQASDVPDFVYEGAKSQLRIGDDLILDGILDTIDHDVSKRGNFMELYGRDRASLMLDCSAPLLSMQRATLEQVVKKAVASLSIKQVEYRAKPSAPAEKVHTEPGQSVWEWLQAACEVNQVWPWMAPNGTLIIGAPNYDTAPAADLILRRDGSGNVRQLRRVRSIHKSYSEITVYGQSPGTEGEQGGNVKGVVTDDTVPLYRPRVVIDGNCDSDELAEQRANKIMADGKMARDNFHARVEGHRVGIANNEGAPWEPGMRVNVYSEPHGVSAIYFLIRRTFTLSKQEGRQTELLLVPDRTWLLNIPFLKAKRRKGYGTRKGHYVESD